VFVKFIRENGYTDPDRLRGAPATQPFPKGSLEIKSSWKVVAPGEDTTRFFTVKTALPLLAFKNGQLVAEPSEAREATVALLGLHVVGVVEGHPEFIWATFEHNDNAPDLPPDFVPDARVPIDTQRSWTLYPKGAKAEDCNKRPGQSPIPPLNFTNEEKQIFEPKVCVFREFPFGGDDEPEIIRGLNASVHQRLPPSSAVWKNYGLVGAIWLNTPDRDFKENTDFTAADAGDPGKKVLGGDKKLSNTTMETFGQSTQNCFSCHNTMMQHMGAEAILPPKRLNVSHILTKVYTHVAQSGKRGTQGCSLVTRKEGGSP